ncbi:unnamed protein product [Vicia faba]|uniref:Uncharacterized protein n=1 Tax=Vicia faba TaxID=3906 RepID=A0AAV1ARQ3_VICFA|nr:unnamed protein product [Vicia faba]
METHNEILIGRDILKDKRNGDDLIIIEELAEKNNKEELIWPSWVANKIIINNGKNKRRQVDNKGRDKKANKLEIRGRTGITGENIESMRRAIEGMYEKDKYMPFLEKEHVNVKHTKGTYSFNLETHFNHHNNNQEEDEFDHHKDKNAFIFQQDQDPHMIT